MKRRRPEKILTGAITPDSTNRLLDALEETDDDVIIGRIRCRRYTVRGVPARLVDVCIDTHAVVDGGRIEVVRKPGRYDGQVRDRITVRALAAHQRGEIVRVDVSRLGETTEIVVGEWARAYRTLRSNLDGYRLARVMMWHWRKYYTHLGDGDAVRSLADQWAAEHASDAQRWTLAEANRSASRELYRFSRSLGWRKLDARQRERSGAPAQWVSETWWARRMAEIGHPTGCGEATLRCRW